MQSIRAVVAMLVLACIGGCGKADSNKFVLGMPTGCSPLSSDLSETFERVALDHFKRNLGVSAVSVRVLAIEDCENKIVVPIEATTEQVPTPRHWYVEFPGKRQSEPVLVRPL